MVVFSPFVNEILVGKVYSMTDENAIRMTLGFFSDLIVLPNESSMNLEKTKWDPNKKDTRGVKEKTVRGRRTIR